MQPSSAALQQSSALTMMTCRTVLGRAASRCWSMAQEPGRTMAWRERSVHVSTMTSATDAPRQPIQCQPNSPNT